MKPTPLLLFYFLLLVNTTSFADTIPSPPANDPVIVVSEKTNELNLSSSIQILEEDNNQYSFEQISSGKFDSLFHKNKTGQTNEWNRSVWAKTRLTSTSDKTTSWILQTDKLYADVNCYIVFPGGKILMQHSGWSLPPSKRNVKDADVIFNLSLAEHQSAEIYLHIQTNLRWSTLDTVKAKLISSDKWNEIKWRKNFFFGLCAGICMLAMFYWLINYLYSSRVNYLYLIAATLSTLIFYLDNYGISTALFWHDAPWYFFSKYGQTFLWFPFMGISGFVLAAKLNHFNKSFPQLVFLFFAYALMTTLFCVISPFLLSWQFSHHITLILYLVGTWLPASMLFYLWLKNQSKAPGFALFSYLPWIIGFNFFALLSFGTVPDNFLFNMMGPSGALFTVVLFFYGMVNYLKAIRQKRENEHEENERLIREQNIMLEQNVAERTRELEIEKEKANELLRKSDELLLNILPVETASELKLHGRSKAKTYGMVTVMFTDFKNFTDISEKVSPELLVAEIDYCFSAFDNIIQKYGIEKIKTIGDAYISAGGLPVLNYTHAADTIYAAIEIRNFILHRKLEKELRGEIPFELRIGIHTGPVVAGIVGVKKFAYDIWGDTVNIAARMESSGEAGKINISGVTYQLTKDKFQFTHRGKIKAKNKGEVDMYFVEELQFE